MNAEQKQRAVELLAAWQATAYALHADRMVNLLQEMVDAPEVEPFAVIHLDGSFVHVEFKQPIAGTGKFEVYAAPPAPSVPDGWRSFLTDVIASAGLLAHGKRDKGLASRIGKFAFDAILSAQQPEPPADVVQDSVASEPVGFLYTNLQSGEYHVSDYDDDYRGPERALWCIEPVYRRVKGQS